MLKKVIWLWQWLTSHRFTLELLNGTIIAKEINNVKPLTGTNIKIRKSNT